MIYPLHGSADPWSLLKFRQPAAGLASSCGAPLFLAGLDEEDFARLRLALAPEEDSLWDILPRAKGIIPEEKPSVFPVSFYFMKRGGKRHEKTASPPSPQNH